MAYVLPIPLPESLVTERRVIAKNDFAHTHHTVAFGPDGRGYIHSEVFYNYLRYDQGDDDLSAQIVTLLSPRFTITKQVWLEDLHREMTRVTKPDGTDSFVFNNSIAPLAVTAHGEIVFTTQQNRMFVYDADVRKRRARFDPLVGEPAGFSDVIAVPGGLVCMRDRNRVGVVEHPSSLVELPVLRDVGSIRDAVALRMRGYYGRFAALDLERILVTSFTGRSRSNWVDAAAFDYVVLGGDGTEVGRFPLGTADTPYGKLGHDDSYAAHQPLGAWLVRSDAAIHAFDRDGRQALRLGLAEDARFAAVLPLTLAAVGPGGELVMVSKKHHLLVVSDPVDAIGSLETVLAEVGAVYAAELGRLKKAVPYANGRWFGFEATTPHAAAKASSKAKKSKQPVVEVVEPRVATNLAEAVSFAPHDIETLSVYADSLATTDPALGDYIQTSIRVQAMAADDPARADLEERTRALFRVDGARWLRTWNTPNTLFEERFEAFGGLPCTVQIEEAPRAVDAIEGQLVGLPIKNLLLRQLPMRVITSLHGVPLLRRITQLLISASSKRKLGKPLLAWLAKQRLANLAELHMYSVEATGLREVVDTMPALVELSAMSGGLSAEGIEALSSAAAAATLRQVNFSYNPLGSAVVPMFARFPQLVDLDLAKTDLGDDVTAFPAPHITATKLDIDDSPRLGAAGLAWIVKAMPGLRDLKLPRELEPDAAEALLPIAAQLERLDASWMEVETKEAIVADIVPRAHALRRLDLTGVGSGFARRIVEHTTLTELTLGHISRDDIAALAGAHSLAELTLGEGADDAGLVALARAMTPAKLHTLHIHSRDVSEVGVAAILDARWPKLASVQLMYAHIRDADALVPIRDRPFSLRLFKCDVPRGQLDQLRRAWGDRLSL